MPAYFETGFFVRQPAWHGLGNVLEKVPATAAEAIAAAGLDWTVRLAELWYRVDGLRRSFKTDRRAVLRESDNSVLGFVSGHYRPIQNRAAFDWAQGLVETGYWSWSTGGALRDGKVCWALLKQDKDQIIPGDIVEDYLLLTWAHDNSRSLVATPTMVRVVCWNTLSSAVWGAKGNKRLVTIRHTGDIGLKLEQAKRLFDHSEEMLRAQKEHLARMAEVKLTDGQLEELVDKVFCIDDDSSTVARRANQFVKQMVVDGRASGTETLEIKNTLYGAVMAIGEVTEHYLGGKRIRDRGASVLGGHAAAVQRQALKLAEAYI